jgi:hypothetical protein
MPKVRVKWDDGSVKALRVSLDGVRVKASGDERLVPVGTLVLSWFALGNSGAPFGITLEGVGGAKVQPGAEFPCPKAIAKKIPNGQTKSFGACTYEVA